MAEFKAVWDNIDPETKKVRVHYVRYQQDTKVRIEI